MGNLVASLIAAESLVTTEAKAKALRPVAEKCITAAAQGRRAPPPPRRGAHPGQGHGPQAVRRDRAPLRGPARRLHPHPQARPAPGRQRARWRASNSSDPVRPRPHGRPRAAGVESTSAGRTTDARTAPATAPPAYVAYDGAAFRGFAVQPGPAHRGRGPAPRPSAVVAAATASSSTCAGRTDAGVHARGQVVHVDVPASAVRHGRGWSGRSTRHARPGRRGAGGRGGRRPGSTPAARPGPARYRYLILERRRRPTRCSPRWPGTCRDPLDLRAMASRRRTSCSASTTSGPSAGACPGTDARRRPSSAGCSTPAGSSTTVPVRRPGGARPRTPGCSGFDIAANSFCHQMVRSLVGTLVEVGRGRRRASDVNWTACGRRPVQPAASSGPAPGPVPGRRGLRRVTDRPAEPARRCPGRLPGARPERLTVVRRLRRRSCPYARGCPAAGTREPARCRGASPGPGTTRRGSLRAHVFAQS